VTRLLRPGGSVVIGTESSDAIQGRIWCWAFRLLRRTPWPPTSTDHTYWFSARSLETFAERAGLVNCRVRVYENRLRDIVNTRAFARATNRARAAMGLYWLAAALSMARPQWGGKLVLVARRPG
jgi:hypothetical protein